MEETVLQKDQLRTGLLVHWSDIPVIFQIDIFEHLGWLLRLRNQRVCRGWKSLLAAPSSVVLIDLCVPFNFRNSPWNRLWYINYPLPNLTVQTKALQSSVTRTAALILDFSDKESASWKASDNCHNQLFGGFCQISKVADALAESQKIRHVIFNKARLMSSIRFTYCSARKFPWWLESLGITAVRRQVTFSLVDCILHYVYGSQDNRIEWGDTSYSLFRRRTVKARLPDFSVESPIDTRTLEFRLLLLVKSLLLPYSNKQLIWLRNCREILMTQGPHEILYGTDRWFIFENRHEKVLNMCIAGMYDEGNRETPLVNDEDLLQYADIEHLALAIFVFAQNAYNGKLDLPFPPEIVTCCSTPGHADSAVCDCIMVADGTDRYKSFRNMERV